MVKVKVNILVKTIWFWHKNRNVDQQNRIENPERNLSAYGQLIYYKAGKNTQWKKDSLFNKWFWENWKATYKRMKLEYSLTPYTEISSQWIKELHIRPDNIKLLEGNIGRMFFDINHINLLFDPPPRIRSIKKKNKPWDLIKLKSFCTAKETIKNKTKQKDNPQNGRKSLQMMQQTKA